MHSRPLCLALLGLLVACERDATAPIDRSITLEAVWSPPDSSVVAAAVPGFPSVRVTAFDGSPVAGYDVLFVPIVSGTTATPTTVTSDADGVATLNEAWVLGPKAGTQRIIAFSDRVGGARVAFDVLAIAAAATELRLTFGASPNVTLGDSLLAGIEFRDAYQNLAKPPGVLTFAFSDSTVLVSSGNWLRAVGSGVARVIARAGSLADTLGVGVAFGAPLALDTARYAGRGGHAITIGPNRVLYTAAFDRVGVARFDLNTRTALSVWNNLTYNRDVKYVPVRDEVWVATEGSGRIDVIDPGSGAVLRTITMPFELLRLLPSADGSVVYATGLYGGLARINAATGSALIATEPTNEGVNGIALSSDGSRLFITSTQSGRLMEFNASTLAFIRSVLIGSNAQEVVVDSSTRRLLVLREFGPATSLDEASLTPLFQTADSSSRAYGAALTSDRKYILLADLNASIQVLDAATFQSYATIPAARGRRVIIDDVTGDAWVVQESSDNLVRVKVTAP